MRRFLITINFVLAIALECFGEGILLLTFDDRNLDSWIAAMPIFAKYDAHATFFMCGNITEDDMAKIKYLVATGHSVGSHTVSHSRVPSQTGNFLVNWFFFLREIRPHERIFARHGLQLKYFAYPYNDHTDESDKLLCSRFALLRSGAKSKYATQKRGCRRLDGSGVGEYYATDIEELCAKIQAISESDDVLCLFSHGIAPDAKINNMKAEWLNEILSAAKRCNVRVLSFDEFYKESR